MSSNQILLSVVSVPCFMSLLSMHVKHYFYVLHSLLCLAGCNKSPLMGLKEIAFLLTMLIMLLMTLAVGKHQFILVYLQFGVAWLAVR